MKSTKTFKVVMLPTSKASLLALNKSDNQILSLDKAVSFKHSEFVENQHLYIISDEPINEDDWITRNNEVIQANDEWDNETHKEWKKIVATTDNDLISGGKSEMAQLPESFIKAFITSYNEGNIITEINLEIGEIIKNDEDYQMIKKLNRYDKRDKEIYESFLGIKTRQDNTVIIHKSESYTKTDLENAYNLGRQDKIASERTGEFINNLEDFINNLK